MVFSGLFTNLRGHFIGVLGGLALILPLIANAALPREILTIPWGFPVAVVRVDDTLPIGTVISVATLPVNTSLHCPGDIRSGILQWSGGRIYAGLTMDSGVPGIGVRLVEESVASGQPTSLRLEMVKTGAVMDGLIRRLDELPEFHYCQWGNGVPRYLVRERFVLKQALFIRKQPSAVDPTTGRLVTNRVS